MARAKKQKPNISDWLKLRWEEQDAEIPESEVYGTCDFCNGDILNTENYFYGQVPHGQEEGMCIFTACKRCVTAAGIKW